MTQRKQNSSHFALIFQTISRDSNLFPPLCFCAIALDFHSQTLTYDSKHLFCNTTQMGDEQARHKKQFLTEPTMNWQNGFYPDFSI